MAEVTIYGVPGSPFMRAVQMGLEEKGAAYRIHALGPGEAKGEAYLARHPFGRIPAFQHGDFELYETQAILRYVDEVLPGPALQPAEPRQVHVVGGAGHHSGSMPGGGSSSPGHDIRGGTSTRERARPSHSQRVT